MDQRLVALAAAQQGLHAGLQLDQLERLGQVVVGTQVQALDAFFEAAARRQDHHGRLRACAAARAQAAQHFEAIELGQAQVEDDEGVVLRVQQAVGLLAVGRAFDRQLGVAQGRGQPA